MWSEIFASNVQIPICSKWDELAGAPISVRPTFLLSEGSCSLWYVKPEIRAQRGKSWGDGREIIKQLSDGKFWLSTEFIIAITWYTQPPQKPFGSEYEEDHHKKVAIKNSFKMLKIFLAKNAILEDILRVISRLRLGCNKCQIKCYEHVPWHSVWKLPEKSHFRSFWAKIECVHEWLAFKSIFFISGVYPRLSWTLNSGQP